MTYVSNLGLDVEGISVLGKADCAWIFHDKLSDATKAKFSKEAIKEYDELDDNMYLSDLNKSARHSTGITPPFILSVAAYDGKTDEELTEISENIVKKNMMPGAREMIEFAKLEFGTPNVYLISNAYPAVPLKMAEITDIPFKQVFSSGYQPKRKWSQRQGTLIEEVKARSPVDDLSENKEKLGKFLTEYLGVCKDLSPCYKVKGRDIENDLLTRAILEKRSEIFKKYVPLGRQGSAIHRTFVTEEGVMGGHRKVDAMRSIEDDRGSWGYVGDSIVDAMGLDYANAGAAVNNTNEHALSFAKMNFATQNVSNLIPVLQAMSEDQFNQGLKRNLDSEDMRVFTAHDIQKDINAVIDANKKAKDGLKTKFVSV